MLKSITTLFLPLLVVSCAVGNVIDNDSSFNPELKQKVKIQVSQYVMDRFECTDVVVARISNRPVQGEGIMEMWEIVRCGIRDMLILTANSNNPDSNVTIKRLYE